ncbi:hypothetical protein FZ103_06720 [Streptomonospora sp. PA3]|uniref:FUSC family protein n=1 Tax=Streptomonospora sp. PA3 TaxID=2607326 RepID=UPI0012DDE34D|nr:aromatic acid exporter family protein [Streptomonospora sp. PA3]MUL40879.1 hypothetical protein [Streptomonospora sp. PA3]
MSETAEPQAGPSESHAPTTRLARAAAALRRARSHAGPERDTLLLVGKSAIAATAAWGTAAPLLHAQSPAFAPFAAILIIQATVRDSVVSSLRFVAAAVLGVSLQGMLGFFFEPNLLTFFTVAVAALLLGQWRPLRRQGSLVTTSAFFAYSVFITSGETVDRIAVLAELIGLVLLGCAIGLIVNVLLLPPMRYRGAQYGLSSVAGSLRELLGDMAASMRDGSLSGSEGDDWAYRARRIESLGSQALDAVGGAQESMRWNPRRLLDRTRPYLDVYGRLIGEVSSAGGRLRSVTDILRRVTDTSNPAQVAFLQRYGEFLDHVRAAVGLLADVEPGRLDDVGEEFADSVVRARELHDEMTRIKSHGDSGTGGGDDLGDVRVHGGLLVEAERMLLELEAASDTLAGTPEPARPE